MGWDETSGSGAYKVFVLTTLGGTSKADVYSSKTNSWKTVVEHGRRDVDDFDIRGVFACGKIHWIIQTTGEEEDYVESWDLASEEFGIIELPPKPPLYYSDGYYVLADIEGCLHLMYVNERQLYAVFWVMKEFVWLKLFTLPLFVDPNPDLLSRPLFGGGPNGEIVVIFIDNYLVYSPNHDDMHVVRAGKNRFSFYNGVVYVESLVSPNQILQQVAS